MAVLQTPREFIMQQVFELLVRNPVDLQISAYLSNLKTTGLENTMEMVYAQGGRGNVYVGGGFAHSRRATLNIESATFNMEVMALQSGTELFQGNMNIRKYDIMTAGTGGTLTTAMTAVGTTNSEILFLYKLADNGSYDAVYTQVAATPEEGQFTYTSATQTITLSATETPVEGDRYAVTYEFRSANNAQRLTITGDGVPATALVTAFGLAKDTCTGQLFPCQIEGLAQIDGNWNFDLAADGDPVVQNLTMEFVKGCLENDLYTFTVYTEDEEGDETP